MITFFKEQTQCNGKIMFTVDELSQNITDYWLVHNWGKYIDCGLKTNPEAGGFLLFGEFRVNDGDVGVFPNGEHLGD